MCVRVYEFDKRKKRVMRRGTDSLLAHGQTTLLAVAWIFATTLDAFPYLEQLVG
jgi:hypothetical protein